MSKSTKLTLLAIGVVALAVVYFAPDRQKPGGDPTLQQAPTQAAGAAAPRSASGLPASPSSEASTAPALPAVIVSSSSGAIAVQPKPAVQRTPVKALESVLQQAGPQGDAQVACRLGVELIRCVRLDFRLTMLEKARKQLEQQPKDSAIAIKTFQEINELARRLDDDRNVCGGVAPPAAARDAWRHLYDAAEAGSVAAMSQFARDPGLDPNDPTSQEGLEAFKKRAPEFLASAIQGGDVKALWHGWFFATNGFSASTMQNFPRDPDKALQYGFIVVNLVDATRVAQARQSLDAIAREVGPERTERARQAAEELRAARFSDTTPIDWDPNNGESDLGECLK